MPYIRIYDTVHKVDWGICLILTALYQTQPRDIVDQVLSRIYESAPHSFIKFDELGKSRQKEELDYLCYKVQFFDVNEHEFLNSPRGKVFKKVYRDLSKRTFYYAEMPEEFQVDIVEEKVYTKILKAYDKNNRLVKVV